MIDALITGKLHALAQERTGKNGKPYTTAKMTAAAGDGENLFVNLIAFEPTTCRALLALAAGDSLAVAGAVTPKAWVDREGTARPALDVVAHQVLTAYHVTRKRRAMEAEQPQQRRPRDGAWQGEAEERDGLDDGAPLDF